MKKKFVIATAIALFSSASYAGECVVKVKREACPGKESQAYKPYNGKIETEEKKTVKDQAACKAEAEKAAKIVRKGVLTKKTATASYDGKAAGSASDSKDCK